MHFIRMWAFGLILSESDYELTFFSFPECTRKMFLKYSNNHTFTFILTVSCAVMSDL